MPKMNDQNDPDPPTQQEIAQRAYELFLQRGSVPGYELDDWLQAEAELTAEAAKEAGTDVDPATDAPSRASSRRGATRERTSTRRTLRP